MPFLLRVAKLFNLAIKLRFAGGETGGFGFDLTLLIGDPLLPLLLLHGELLKLLGDIVGELFRLGSLSGHVGGLKLECFGHFGAEAGERLREGCGGDERRHLGPKLFGGQAHFESFTLNAKQVVAQLVEGGGAAFQMLGTAGESVALFLQFDFDESLLFGGANLLLLQACQAFGPLAAFLALLRVPFVLTAAEGSFGGGQKFFTIFDFLLVLLAMLLAQIELQCEFIKLLAKLLQIQFAKR